MILIVDDKAENIYSLKKLLEVNNFEVDTASSGEEALKKVLKNNYALIIMDVQMPGMDGFEVAEVLSGTNKGKDIPIIFLSAISTEKKFVTKGYNSGGIDYVAKPVDPDILLLKVKTFSRLYQQARTLNEMQAVLRQEIEVRKAAEAEQQNKVQELHGVLESMPQIAFTANRAGFIEYANDEWYRYSDNKNKFPEVCNKNINLYDEVANAISAGVPLTLEANIKRLSDNEFRHHLLKLLPVKHDNVIVKWVGTFTDIHEQKLINEMLEQHVADRTRELQEANKALATSNNDLQQFASVASHDLKEPLRKIQVFSSILFERYEEQLNKEATGYLEKITSASQRMTVLINDLLNYSRLSIKNLFEPTDINAIICRLLEDLEIIIMDKDAEINVGPIPELEVIPGQIRQVLQNIISNALKFTQKGNKPVISIRAERVSHKEANSPADANGTFCRISISDNGIGFDEVYIDKIFTIFQRLNSREEFEGTGIGLAIAKKIIEQHDGIITARSKEGEGSTFIIVLPLHQELNQKNSEI